ncbi:NAD(P)/FAD-dependent oxidoreductase [Clostridium chauvoei]|uniref:FAD-dependent oxidoreductase n=2 Tax=Clostridium chauvoei TaxID=46867 RepID=A0ABD4RKU2_9CLOT|nr:FAD-dependent oxidoreductase [Clostridium chauvoei]ATD55968.1 tRNA uridine 5-carboxymethylaminomethyl modification protein [Clostridium chauvoei]ATD56361.1 tRNA uridine 5-carboxymethylaminomethyl modification protein [Clostridium chauvoei]MBX7281566.1 FAD-dependent oxidoreductase [Clostridium chauvoei]MBX7284095.1 FAD-dependent oxidoreductase [Clostridium chauvoei]MBX7286614.1 FAD-dependent oxidoreductase [Clostridium chauvoei]
MLQYDLVIIGGGASGLSAGVSSLKQGIKNVLILERNSDLGGNLNLFIHKGFGKYYLNKEVTGPELSTILINDYKSLGGAYKTDAQVLKVTENKIITFVSPKDGVVDIEAKSIILASGCREKYTGNVIVPIHKYTGIFTIASAHKLINFQGYLPGKEVVIWGRNEWSLLLARRLIIEGAKVKVLIDDSENELITEHEEKIISGFDINIIQNSRIIEVSGNERIQNVVIENIDNGLLSNIECDSLVLTVGYYPELDFISKSTNIDLDEDYIPEVLDYETSIKGIYACGTILHGEDGIIYSGEEGYKVGKIVADNLK